MKKKELIDKVERLEREVEKLKSSPPAIIEKHHYHSYPYYPSYPIYVGDPPFYPYPYKYYLTTDDSWTDGTITTNGTHELTNDTFYVDMHNSPQCSLVGE